MNPTITLNFDDFLGNAAREEKSEPNLVADMEFIDEAFSNACALLSDELWDGCMSRGMKRIEKGSQRISFQHFRTPGINSKVIAYTDSKNGISVLFEKSISRNDCGFRVMQAFQIPETPNQPADIIYPFSSFGKPKASDVAFLKKVAAKGILNNFLLQ